MLSASPQAARLASSARQPRPTQSTRFLPDFGAGTGVEAGTGAGTGPGAPAASPEAGWTMTVRSLEASGWTPPTGCPHSPQKRAPVASGDLQLAQRPAGPWTTKRTSPI